MPRCVAPSPRRKGANRRPKRRRAADPSPPASVGRSETDNGIDAAAGENSGNPERDDGDAAPAAPEACGGALEEGDAPDVESARVVGDRAQTAFSRSRRSLRHVRREQRERAQRGLAGQDVERAASAPFAERIEKPRNRPVPGLLSPARLFVAPFAVDRVHISRGDDARGKGHDRYSENGRDHRDDLARSGYGVNIPVSNGG